jgi:hypothetical protein
MASKTDYDAKKAADTDAKIRKSRSSRAFYDKLQREREKERKAREPERRRKDAKFRKENLTPGWAGLSDKVLARDMGERVGLTTLAQDYGEGLLAEARAEEGAAKKTKIGLGTGYGDRSSGAVRTGGGFKKGGAVIKEKGTGEVYKSKATMKKHEAKESPAMERKEHGYMKGGKVSTKNVKMPNVVKAGSVKLK